MKPSWLKKKLPRGNLHKIFSLCQKEKIHTVCQEANCPNLCECFSKKTATFLALGKVCTRKCSFCHIGFDLYPDPPDPQEPEKIAKAVKSLQLKHVVLTMVTRDDLPDGGAYHMAKIIQATRKNNSVTIEVLTSDFANNRKALDIILDEKPDVFNHNIEVVKPLSTKVRHIAQYDSSLEVLKYAKESNKIKHIKSGLMVGLGETLVDVKKAIKDLHDVGCNIITIGQYLQPNRKNLAVKEYIHPSTFEDFATYGYLLGVKHMFCGPFVRSSYLAKNFL